MAAVGGVDAADDKEEEDSVAAAAAKAAFPAPPPARLRGRTVSEAEGAQEGARAVTLRAEGDACASRKPASVSSVWRRCRCACASGEGEGRGRKTERAPPTPRALRTWGRRDVWLRECRWGGREEKRGARRVIACWGTNENP